jgi:hypothetical protein
VGVLWRGRIGGDNGIMCESRKASSVFPSLNLTQKGFKPPKTVIPHVCRILNEIREPAAPKKKKTLQIPRSLLPSS